MFKEPDKHYRRAYDNVLPGWVVPLVVVVFFAFAGWCSLHVWGEVVLTAVVLAVGLPGIAVYAPIARGK